jgi:2-oxoglutarate/2-oxoacid ferredoxin oxidoreductase subunit beta
MDNFVYGLTKKQTSPTSPIGFKSKTDPSGAVDRPINPMKKLLNSGATFVARSHATQVKHMVEMYERAINHRGFSVIEILSECVEFYPGAFDAGIPRKGGAFNLIEEKTGDGTPEDESRHDVTDGMAAFRLADLEWPGVFGVFYDNPRMTKNDHEAALVKQSQERVNHAGDLDILRASFRRMK